MCVHATDAYSLRVQYFRVVPRFSLKFMPTQGSAHTVYDSTGDDHDGGPAAGVAYGFDPAAGEPSYQFGELWDP